MSDSDCLKDSIFTRRGALKEAQGDGQEVSYLIETNGVCDEELEGKIRAQFFTVLHKLSKRMASNEHSLIQPDEFVWSYQSSDLPYLVELDIFDVCKGRGIAFSTLFKCIHEVITAEPELRELKPSGDTI